MLVDDGRILARRQQLVDQRVAFGLVHAVDPRRHQPVDVERLAPGLAMGNGDRVGEVAHVRHVVAHTRPVGAAVFVHLQRGAPADPLPGRVGQAVIGCVHVGEQRVAALRRDFQRVKHCRLVRILVVAHVGVEPHLPVMGEAERLAVAADVGDHHDAGLQLLAVEPALRAWREHPAGLAEQPGEGELPMLVDVLAAEHQDQMVEPRAAQQRRLVAIDRAAQIDAGNLGPERFGSGQDLDAHRRLPPSISGPGRVDGDYGEPANRAQSPGAWVLTKRVRMASMAPQKYIDIQGSADPRSAGARGGLLARPIRR